MRLTHILLFVPLLLCGCARDKEALNILGNMTYYVSQPLFTDKAELINGKHHEEFLSAWLENQYVYGDFNHDGLKDAAVILVENYGGNADSYILAFLINDGKRLMHKSSIFLETWAIINSVKERSGEVLVDMYVHQEGDCNAGPSKRVREVYKYEGSEDVPFTVREREG